MVRPHRHSGRRRANAGPHQSITPSFDLKLPAPSACINTPIQGQTVRRTPIRRMHADGASARSPGWRRADAGSAGTRGISINFLPK